MSSEATARGIPRGAARPLRWAALEGAPGAQAVRAAGAPPVQAAAAVPSAAQAEARAVIEGARREAEALRAEAAEAGRREGLAAGLAEGRRQGLAEGRRAARAETANLRAEAEALLRQAHEERRRVLESLAGDVAQLALDVARAVLHREVEQAPEEIVTLARRLLRRVETPAVLRVHPSLAPVLEAEAAHLAAAVTVRPDAAVAPGGLVVESEEGVLDATIDGQLARVAEALAGGAGDAD